jgi:phosphatidate phosphatase APP1
MEVRMWELFFKKNRQFVNKFLGNLSLIKVEPFLCFGNEEKVFIKGRVINAYKQSKPKATNFFIKNIFASFRRYAVTSVANANVKINYNGNDINLQTNQEGVFEVQIVAKPPSNGADEFVSFQVIPKDSLEKDRIEKKLIKRILKSQKIAVISDIDDTIVVSHATSVGKKFWLSISKNAYTRRPFPGVSQFYQDILELEKAVFFYVSSSDWSLFDLIQDFLTFREIPLGPIFLKDKHINLKNVWKSGGGDHFHKLEKIYLLMDMFPQMNFYLIGDSGQKDPEIYSQVLEKYPNRIKAVIIRMVNEMEEARKERLRSYSNGVKIAFVKDTEAAMTFYHQINSRVYEK